MGQKVVSVPRKVKNDGLAEEMTEKRKRIAYDRQDILREFTIDHPNHVSTGLRKGLG